MTAKTTKATPKVANIESGESLGKAFYLLVDIFKEIADNDKKED